jgi:hypothetical protein
MAEPCDTTWQGMVSSLGFFSEGGDDDKNFIINASNTGVPL